jgi:putative transposase
VRYTIYAWKAKYGGMEASEAQRLKQLEDENGRLKRLVADLSLDREMLKAVIAKKRPELVDRRTDASWLEEHFAASERRGCGLMG